MHRSIKEVVREILERELPEEVQELLLPHQVPDVQNLIWILENNPQGPVACNLSDTGTGKSYSAMAVARSLGVKLFAVSPRSGISNLFRVAESFGVELLGMANLELLKGGSYYPTLQSFEKGAGVSCPFLAPVKGEKGELEGVVWNLPPRTLVLVDEAHQARHGRTTGQETGNSKLLVSLRALIPRKPAGRKREEFLGVLLMSATLTDKLENFDVLAYLLGLYRPYHPRIYRQFLRGLELSHPGEELFEVIHHLLFPTKASRMSIQSIKRRTGDEIFRANDVKAISYKAERGLSEKLEGNHRKLLNSSTLPKKDCFFSLWEENELLRIPAAMEEVTKHLERGCSVVVFVNFNSTRSRLEELFLERGVQSKRIGMLHGTQPREERERVVRGFMEDRIWLLLANIKVGGMALSLHDLRGKRQRVSVIFPTWSATQLKQALGRIYRANARSDAIQRILFCSSEGGIEERLCDLMNEKLRNLELLHTGGEELDLLSELFQQLM